MNKNINFAVSGYKYAPESFNGYIIFNKNKRIKLNLTSEEKSLIGYTYITKGYKKAIDEVKRIIRNENKKVNNDVVFGFYKENSKTEYIYSRDTLSNNNNIIDKLFNYKYFKQYLKNINCEIIEYTQGSLDGNYKTISKEEIKSKIDITRPIKLNVKSKNRLFA